MLRSFQRILWALAIAGAVNSASAFSLLGPLDGAYQTVAIGYNPLGTDIGGPMALGEEYRWNLRVIYYGFDPSFANYFGQRGVDEVNKAIAILNALPTMSSLSSNLTEFPTHSVHVNYTASALGLIDLKSVALALLVQEMGLTSPERYTFTLRDVRTVSGTTFYLVINRNYDPVTLTPSRYVNGTLYTYHITDPTPTIPTFADAIESTVDPLDFGYNTVISAVDGFWGNSLLVGDFFTGLTRDDVGGLRYIYAGKKFFANPNTENLVANAITNAPGVFGGPAWSPVGVVGAVGTALRPGVDKITFKQLKYQSTFGAFISVTNSFKDSYTMNNHTVSQTLNRGLLAPDIVFSAADLGVDAGGNPNLSSRSASFVNNAAINATAGAPAGTVPTAGPGQIVPSIYITFSKLGPAAQNATPNFLDEVNLNQIYITWGSYDGTTNLPVVYPNGNSIQALVQQVFGGN